ncbi:MAG: 2OG-Fe(II) oxygenase [Micropepsaceae bacterium]
MSRPLVMSPEAFDFVCRSVDDFRRSGPFNHLVVENFFEPGLAERLSAEFPAYGSEKWFTYANSIENKKALNNWNEFPAETYASFSALNAPDTVAMIAALTGVPMFPDPGLHGGGWHMHGEGGNLNPHLDYSLHPKLGLQRKINIIVYLEEGLEDADGGHLGLWEASADRMAPGRLVKEVQPRFNRAIIFDTSQDSWHGMSRALTLKPGKLRKSHAIYYLCRPEGDVDPRQRALFAPRENQMGDKAVEALIRARADVVQSRDVYRQAPDGGS